MISRPSTSASFRRHWLLLGGVLLLSMIMRFPAAEMPLERDEGEYAYIAQRWTKGEIPYRDCFDQKPPGIFLVYRIAFAVAGQTPSAIHWTMQVMSLGTLSLLFLMGSQLFRGSMVALGASFFATLCLAGPALLGNAANTEVFMILPGTAAVCGAWIARHRKHAGWAFAAGLCSGLALLFKQVALFNALFVVLLLGGLWRRAWKLQVAHMAGCAVVWVPVLAYFMGHGALREFWDCVFGHNFTYASQEPLTRYALNLDRGVQRFLFTDWPIAWLALLGILATLWRPSRKGGETSAAPDRDPGEHSAARWFILWLLLSLAAISVGGFFRDHYFIQVVPPLSLLAAVGVSRISWLSKTAARLRMLPIFLFAVAAIQHGSTLSWYYSPGMTTESCHKIYRGAPFAESPQIAEFIRKRTPDDTRILIFGSEPQILFYAGRRSATRYIFLYPFASRSPKTAQRVEELWHEVMQATPEFIITTHAGGDFLWSSRREKEELLPFELPDALFVRMRDELQQSYRVVGVLPTHIGEGMWWLESPLRQEQWKRLLLESYPLRLRNRLFAMLAVWQRITPPSHERPPPTP